MAFEFSAYARALEAKDVEALLAFYAPDAEWVEYRPGAPPSAPARIRGHAAIAELLRGVAADAGVTLAVSHQVVGEDRIAFRITVGLPGGRRDIEHAICELRDGLIVEHAEVEAWDPEDPYGGREPTSHERRAGEPWDASYAGGPAPWDIGRPQPAIVRLAAEGAFAGAVLDAGCGTGDNALHIASLGLDVLGVD